MANEAIKSLNDILAINKTTLTQYNKLAELEIERKTDSKEYKETIENIKIIKEIIDKKLSEIKIEPKVLIDYESLIARMYGYQDDDILLQTLAQDLTNLDAKRLTMQIYFYSLINHICVIDDELECDFLDFFFDRDELDDMFRDDANKELDFDLIKEYATNYTFMDYLLEAIEKEKDEEVRKVLIRTKYNFIYLLPHIEHRFIQDQKEFTNSHTFQELIPLHRNNVNLEDEFIIPNEEIIKENLYCFSILDETYFDNKDNNIKVYLISLYVKTLNTLNISISSIKRIKEFRGNLKVKSQKSEKYIKESFNINEELCRVKKVDL